jgi:hypothetical protein
VHDDAKSEVAAQLRHGGLDGKERCRSYRTAGFRRPLPAGWLPWPACHCRIAGAGDEEGRREAARMYITLAVTSHSPDPR